MSSDNNQRFRYEEEATGKFARKSKESPAFVLGIIGLVGALGVAAYKYKHRGTMSTSVFLMQTRVAAQGVCVGALTLGLAYNMINKFVLHNED